MWQNEIVLFDHSFCECDTLAFSHDLIKFTLNILLITLAGSTFMNYEKGIISVTGFFLLTSYGRQAYHWIFCQICSSFGWIFVKCWIENLLLHVFWNSSWDQNSIHILFNRCQWHMTKLYQFFNSSLEECLNKDPVEIYVKP